MINAGFNPLQQISEKTGKSIAQLKEEMSKGAISAEMVQQAFLDATSAGGKFYNMSENASKTINGQISMMQDAMDAAFNEIGTKTEGIIINSIKAATSLIQNYEKIGKVLVGLVTTYGAYRTAVFLATAATSKYTIAEIALTNVRIAARKAQQLLNAAMMTNPYVALATVVAGLAATMWTLRDSTTAAERAQKDFNSMKEESARKEKEHANAIQGLIEKVRDETQANKDRIAAMVALKQEYPNIFKQYDIEKLKLADILDIQRQINEEDARRRRQNAVASIAAQEGRVKAIESMRQTPSWAGRNKFASDKNFDQATELLKQQRNDYLMTYSLPEFAKTLKGKTEEQLNEVLNSLKQTNYFSGSTFSDALLGELKMADIKSVYPDFYKALGDAVNTELQSRQPSGIDYATAKKEWDAAKRALADIENDKDKFTDEQRQAAIDRKKKAGDAYKGLSFSAEYEVAEEEWKDAKKALEDIEKDKDKFSTAQYKAAETRKDTAETNFKKLGGYTTGKTDRNAAQTYNEQLAQQERVSDAQIKSDKERARTAKDMEFMVEQARISAMKEGAEKKRAQRELDNKKELEDLERQKQEYIEKVVAQEKAIFDAQEEQKAKNDKNYKKQSFDSVAVAAKVDTKAYDDAYEYTAQKQKNQQDEVLADLLERYKSYEDRKQELTISYLNDTDELQSMYEETGDERYKRSLDERHKAYVKALNALEKEMGSSDYKLIFGDPSKMTGATIEKALTAARKKIAELDKDADPESFQALSEAIERLENARDNNPFVGWDTSVNGLIQKLYEIRNIRKDIAKYEKEGNNEALEGAKTKLEKSKSDLKKNIAGVGVDAFAEGLNQAADAMARIADISGDPQLKQTAEILNGTANVIASTAQGAAAGGWIGALVGGLTAILGETVDAIVGSEAAFAANQKAMEDYGRGLKELALSLDEDVYDTIFGESVWTKIEHMQEKLMEAKKAYDEYVKASVKYMKVTSKIAPDGTIIETGIETGLTSIANAAIEAKGRNKKKYSGTLGTIFSDLFDEQGKLKTDKIEKAKEALKTLQSMELKNDEGVGILEEAIRLDEIAEEHTEKLKDAAKDYLGSVGASLGDSIVDSILRGEDALESFADVAGGIIEQIARDFAGSWMIENYLKNFEEDMQNAFLTGDAKQVTEIVGSIVEGLPSVLEAGQNAAKEILDMTVGTNYDLYEKHAKEGSSQQASTKGYQSLSEDTGNELAGRMLAQYESNLRMEEATRSMKLSVDLMADNQIQIRDIAAESRALIANSYLELQQIRDNTGAIIKPIQNLSDKIDGWDSYIKSL